MKGELKAELLRVFEACADTKRAAGQQAYMKSSMPFYGITVPDCRKISRKCFRAHPPSSAGEWRNQILDLWRNARFREERYAAIELLTFKNHRDWLDESAIDLVEELVVTGAWWDFVDHIASVALGHMLATQPRPMKPILRAWATDDDMWKRRSAILSQLKFKAATDEPLLFGCIKHSMSSGEFFLRKAIGWALREYSKTSPSAVADFIAEQEDKLSSLSRKEGLRVLVKNGFVDS